MKVTVEKFKHAENIIKKAIEYLNEDTIESLLKYYQLKKDNISLHQITSYMTEPPNKNI